MNNPQMTEAIGGESHQMMMMKEILLIKGLLIQIKE